MAQISDKRILITQADEFMGPAICELLKQKGAQIIEGKGSLRELDSSADLISNAGSFDVLIINLAIKAPSLAIGEIDDENWRELFETIVDPLPRLVKAASEVFKARGGGKIILIGSASALRGMAFQSAYSAARGAQLAFVQAAGVELARHNIQLNAIAQNFVDNPTYFPSEVQANPKFQERLKREVPLGRLVSAKEDASFIAYLCSDEASCFVGQIFPICGGWVVR